MKQKELNSVVFWTASCVLVWSWQCWQRPSHGILTAPQRRRCYAHSIGVEMKTWRCGWVCWSPSPAGPRQWAYKEQVAIGLATLEPQSRITCPYRSGTVTGACSRTKMLTHRLKPKERKRKRWCPTVPSFLLLRGLLPTRLFLFLLLFACSCWFVFVFGLELCAGDCCTLDLTHAPQAFYCWTSPSPHPLWEHTLSGLETTHYTSSLKVSSIS